MFGTIPVNDNEFRQLSGTDISTGGRGSRQFRERFDWPERLSSLIFLFTNSYNIYLVYNVVYNGCYKFTLRFI